MNLSLAARRCVLGWVLLALLGAQALGQLHRVVHAQGASMADAHAQSGAAGDAGAAGRGGWLEALFAGHDGYSGCLSFDAAGHDGVAAPVAAVTPALPAAQQRVAHGPFAVAACGGAPFQARGPPLPC